MGRRLRRRRVLAITAGGLALVLTPVMAGASPLTSTQIYKPVAFFRFCAEAQLDIANINETTMLSKGLSITSTTYDDTGDFKNATASVGIASKKIMDVAQYTYRSQDLTKPQQILCKMRSAESLTQGAWPANGVNNSGRFAVERFYGFGSTASGVATSTSFPSCSVVNQRTINNVWAGLTTAQKAASPYDPTLATPTLLTATDVFSNSFATWANYQPGLTVSGGKLYLNSRDWQIPTGIGSFPALSGAQACSFVAPQLLRDVLLGTASPS